jgi:hypothetical protein
VQVVGPKLVVLVWHFDRDRRKRQPARLRFNDKSPQDRLDQVGNPVENLAEFILER